METASKLTKIAFGKEIELTENEMAICNAIDSLKEDGNDYIMGEDLEYYTGIPNKKARGILASMVKKGLLDVNRQEGGLISSFWDK